LRFVTKTKDRVICWRLCKIQLAGYHGTRLWTRERNPFVLPFYVKTFWKYRIVGGDYSCWKREILGTVSFYATRIIK